MIIFINGSVNSGKSTISKVLQQKLQNTAIIEVDFLRAFIDWMPITESLPLNHKNTISVTRNFVETGLNVIIPYPMSKNTFDYICENFTDFKVDIHAFTLNPSLEWTLQEKGERKLDEWEKERINYHYSKGINNPGYGIVLDTTDQNPEEIAEIILKNIGHKK